MTKSGGRRGRGPRARDASEAQTPETQLVDSGGPSSPERVRRFALHVVEGPATGASFTSSADRCSIGSDPSNDLVIDDPTVSRFHCEIVIEATGARVRDLESSNGTVLDGVRIYDGAPRGGSLLRLGHSVIRFEFAKAHNTLPVSAETRFGTLVGRSIAMRAAFAMLAKAARSNATILLHGETGTGKEEAARSIHDASQRAGGPFVVVDCGALPGDLLESELFGHQKGAFTGAHEPRVGAFEAASGGTIFLDEIGELPLDLQPSLLRVLETREVRRVGSNEHTPVDVRIVAATNRDLRAEVNQGRFRADLFYRLGVVRIVLPPLRERPEDFAPLVERFLDTLAPPPGVAERLRHPEFVSSLAQYAWQGNVRELRNYLERCIVLEEPMPVEQPVVSGSFDVDTAQPYTEARRAFLDEFERRYIERILDEHQGNVTRAARAAGIGRVYFYKLLNRHGLR